MIEDFTLDKALKTWQSTNNDLVLERAIICGMLWSLGNYQYNTENPAEKFILEMTDAICCIIAQP